MSGLALVTGRLAPGVWRGGSMPRTELTNLARGLGWIVHEGQISAVEDKATYLDELGAIAGVPDYVRPNWDSMADGLRDTGITTPRLLVIQTNRPTPFDATAIEILDEAVGFWAVHDAIMQVAWFGPVEAPDLDQVNPDKRSRR